MPTIKTITKFNAASDDDWDRRIELNGRLNSLRLVIVADTGARVPTR